MGQEGIVRAAVNAYPPSIDERELPKEFSQVTSDDGRLLAQFHVCRSSISAMCPSMGRYRICKKGLLQVWLMKSRVFVSKAANLRDPIVLWNILVYVFLPHKYAPFFNIFQPFLSRIICVRRTPLFTALSNVVLYEGLLEYSIVSKYETKLLQYE
jgi:hypothetical protein